MRLRGMLHAARARQRILKQDDEEAGVRKRDKVSLNRPISRQHGGLMQSGADVMS